MSAHYAMCKYDDATGSYIPLEVRPITDKLKKDDPLYQDGFQAGAASRDAEIDQLRTELVKALAACKAKDEALRAANHSCIEDWPLLREALAIQPDTSALESLIQKTSEMARERCAKEGWMAANGDCEDRVASAIRALPAVTLEDLK